MMAFLKFWLIYKVCDFIFFLLTSILFTDILLDYGNFPFFIPETIIKFLVSPDT